MLPETHAGELFETVLPDLMQAVRAPEHPDTENLLKRARQEISDAWSDPLGEWTAIERAWHDAATIVQFDTLLAVAFLLVEKEVEIP